MVQRAGAEFYDSGIQKQVPILNKCLENAGDYVEKHITSSVYDCTVEDVENA